MTDTNMENNSNNTEVEDTQGAKTFTQDELNLIVQKRVAAEQKKFEGVNITEYTELKSAAQQAEEDMLLKRNDFDKILKQTKERSDAELNKLRGELTSVRVDGALVNAASKNKATNPDHVAKLLRANVQLNDEGQPTVLDEAGEVRYNIDKAEPFSIDDLVTEFMSANPYFKSAGKPGTNSASNTNTKTNQEISLENLDLTRPDHRVIYAQMVKDGKVA